MKGPSQDVLDLAPETLDWYEEMSSKREGLADDARAEAGETDFQLGLGLRVTWLSAQRLDKTLMPCSLRKRNLQQATG